jgi:hypothetical protein
VRVQLDEFQKAGGSAKCLTLRLDVPATSARRTQPRAASHARAPSAAHKPLAKQALSR